MPNAFSYRTIHKPRKPFEKVRLLREIQTVGKHGLKNKNELWRAENMFGADKKEARILLTSTNPEDLSIKGRDLIERLTNNGILSGIDLTSRADVIGGLNAILSLTIDHYLERRLQFRVFAAGLAKSVHHARNLIARKQISIKGKVIKSPGYIVQSDEEGFIEFASHSYSSGGKTSRRQRKLCASKAE